MGEHCYWAACLKLAAAEAAAVAAAGAAGPEAAGPEEGKQSKTTQKLLPTSLIGRCHQHLLGTRKPSRFFTVALAVECISHLELLVAFAAYLQSNHHFYSYLQGTTNAPEPPGTASAVDIESKVTSCDKLHE